MTTWESYPQVTTMGVGLQTPKGPVWQLAPLVPPGWESLGGGGTASLGSPNAVTTGGALPGVGTWFVASGSNGYLVNNPLGTSTSPATGNAYKLTWV